eukprot:TRINITY_DN97797_c0_g1_i1.p1 TRINITY_DN97797_c0_g1~~TRINITY_DN97797_c0_g1_i1.p1  ORF type:complete len:416 (-),score=31.14 TRINITY_DN97797_c0_g1_i1:12-1259(-)
MRPGLILAALLAALLVVVLLWSGGKTTRVQNNSTLNLRPYVRTRDLGGDSTETESERAPSLEIANATTDVTVETPQRSNTSAIRMELWSHYLTPGRGNYAAIRAFLAWMYYTNQNVSFHFRKCKSIPLCHEAAASNMPDVVMVLGLGNRGRPRHSNVQYIGYMRDKVKRRAIWFLLADEWCEWRGPGLYHADIVFRTYYYASAMASPKIKYLPLGVSHLFPMPPKREPVLPSAQRRYLFNSMCSVATSRSRLALREVTQGMMSTWKGRPFFHHYSSVWSGTYGSSAGYVPTAQFRTIMGNSVFTIAPFGHAQETFRMWEALEMGSIPIIMRPWIQKPCGYAFKPLMQSFGDLASPFVVLQNWSEIPAYMARAERELETTVRQHQLKMALWYEQLLQSTYGEHLKRILTLGMERLP